MYCRYPSLIRELTSCLSQAIASDPSKAYGLLRTIIDELESDQHLMEALFQEILRRSRANDEGLRERLFQACKDGDSEAIQNSFYNWEVAGTHLRELVEHVIALSHRGFFPITDQDQETNSAD